MKRIVIQRHLSRRRNGDRVDRSRRYDRRARTIVAGIPAKFISNIKNSNL